MSLQRRAGVVFCALGLVFSSQLARATTIVGSMQDSFSDYAVGTFSNITPPSTVQNGGVGFNATGDGSANDPTASWGAVLNAGAARSVTSPGLTSSAVGYFNGTGNKLTLNAAAGNVTQNIGRNLGQTIDTGTTYFSLLMSKNTNDTIRTFNMAFENSTSERFAVGQIGAAAGNTGGNIGLLMNNSNPAGLVQAANPIAMGNGITHLIIGRIDWNPTGNETVSIWVDPADVSSEAAAGAIYVSTSGFELTAINQIRPFAGNNATITGQIATAVSANFDEIRLGGTWASVTTSPVTVPEPSSMALVSMGVSVIIASYRRQQKRT